MTLEAAYTGGDEGPELTARIRPEGAAVRDSGRARRQAGRGALVGDDAEEEDEEGCGLDMTTTTSSRWLVECHNVVRRRVVIFTCLCEAPLSDAQLQATTPIHAPRLSSFPSHLHCLLHLSSDLTLRSAPSLPTMVQTYSHHSTVPLPFSLLAPAYFLRYPNPFATHVLSVDVLDRLIVQRGETPVLLTSRLLLKKGTLPRWAPRGLIKNAESWVLEVSEVDLEPANAAGVDANAAQSSASSSRQMRTWTRNLDHTTVLAVAEGLTFTELLRADPKGKQREWNGSSDQGSSSSSSAAAGEPSTHCLTSAHITSDVSVIWKRIEKFGLKRFMAHMDTVSWAQHIVGLRPAESLTLLHLRITSLRRGSPDKVSSMRLHVFPTQALTPAAAMALSRYPPYHQQRQLATSCASLSVLPGWMACRCRPWPRCANGQIGPRSAIAMSRKKGCGAIREGERGKKG